MDHNIIVHSATKFPANMFIDRVSVKDDFVESLLKFVYTLRKYRVRFEYM